MLELHPNQIPEYLKKYFKPKYEGKPLIRRNTIIWHKRNAMPSSAKDRFSNDFEYVYFFVKQGDYWFKQQREASTIDCKGKQHFRNSPRYVDQGYAPSNSEHTGDIGEATGYGNMRAMRCVWDIPTKPSSEPHFAQFPDTLVEPMLAAGCPPDGIVLDPFAGMATVASVAIKQEKHFIMIDASPEYCERSKKRIALEKQQMKVDLK